MAKPYGDRVRKARLAAGLSQTELAEKVGVTQPAVWNWEAGNTEPREPQRKALEKVLGLGRSDPIGNGSTISPANAFGVWLVRSRVEADMSVPELSAASGVSTVGIYNIESGKSLNPRSETRKKLADALNTKIPDDVERVSEEEQEIEGLGALSDFDPYDPQDRPTDAGVYVFYDISDRPVYIGKAQNIKKRIEDHQEKFWFKQPIVHHAAFIRISNEKLRHQIEQTLIRFLKSNAVINKQSVDRS
ncbi:MAG: helix-turn-helix domain-containing protein [Methylocystis sp.]